ncbi:MAG TPA: glycosyltransferase 87 family protein [Pilimelia sp.]|nr:glycosyltransferase 87 family protein [Pilimelia sp.]
MPTEPVTASPGPGPAADRAPRRASGAITAARASAVAAVAAATMAALWWYGNRHDFFDLRIYVSAMRWWADGNPLYDWAQPDRVQGQLYFTYPPFTALLLRPFADVPLGVTIALFTAGTAVALGVTTWWLVTPLADRHRWPRWFVAGLAIPLVFFIEPTRETIAFGQINMLLIVLILGDLLFAVPRKWRLAGVGIGLATAIKLFPGIFIVYLLLTRRWRAAGVAAATATAATLLAAALAPQASWQFWTEALWSTERVGRTDYTGNQSFQGLLSRLTAPEAPDRLVWLAAVAVIAGYGLWRATRAARAGDEVTGLALTGLVAALISPLTWPHHVYWFVPAIVVLVGAALAPGPVRGRLGYAALAVVTYAVAAFGVVSFVDFGVAAEPTDSVGEFLLRNAYVLLALVLLVALPVREPVDAPTATAVAVPDGH